MCMALNAYARVPSPVRCAVIIAMAAYIADGRYRVGITDIGHLLEAIALVFLSFVGLAVGLVLVLAVLFRDHDQQWRDWTLKQ